MRIGEILNGVYDKDLGWRPASGSIKPVHIANGLFRELTGQIHDIDPLIEFLVPWKSKAKKLDHPERSFETLVLHSSNPRYAVFQDENKKGKFEKLREFSRGILSADGAVFPDAKMTSLSLTCQQMISSDDNDRKVGSFAASIIKGEDNGGQLSELTKRCLEQSDPSQLDPITFLAWPLLSTEEKKYVPKDPEAFNPYNNKKLKQFFENLKDASNNLYKHEEDQVNNLATLQRVVHFSCLALLTHVQALSVNGRIEERHPLLLVVDAVKGSRLAVASELSLFGYYSGFENWLAARLAHRLKKNLPIIYATKDGRYKNEKLDEIPVSLRKPSVRNFLSNISTDKGETPDRDLLNDRMGLFEQSIARHGKDDAYKVLGDTLVQCYLKEYTSGGPREFLGAVGRKVGLVYPHFAGRSRNKRVRPSVGILDVLVESCCPVDEPIPFNEFQNVLWNTFGLIVGGRESDGKNDHEILAEKGIHISPTDLECNSAAFIDNLVEIGLARKYPDNVAYVGKYHV